VRAILYDSKLPKALWGEILKAVVYIWERSPNAALNGMTAYEAWTGQKPEVGHFRRLGCRAYKLIRKALHQKKLDDRGETCFLVGYEGQNLYRLWNPTSGKVERAKDVLFDEDIRINPETQLTLPLISANIPAPPCAEMLLPAHQLQRLNQIPVDQPSAAERAAALQPTDPGNLDTLEAHTPVEGESHAQPEHYVTSLPPVKCKRRYDPRPDNDPGDPEALPQEWTFLEDLQLRIRQLETDHRPLPSLYQKDIPRNVQRLAMEAYTSALDNLDAMEPKTYKAACEGPHADDWKAAMDDEFQSLRENETWELVNESTATNLLSGKWVYRLKRGADGRITRYKARWVVRGFEQEYGIDYNETFASVVRQKTYRSLFALAAIHDWEIEQMDVKTAFLYGPVNETILVQLLQDTNNLERPVSSERPSMVSNRRPASGFKRSPKP